MHAGYVIVPTRVLRSLQLSEDATATHAAYSQRPPLFPTLPLIPNAPPYSQRSACDPGAQVMVKLKAGRKNMLPVASLVELQVGS